jgi:hypothetical protein
MTIQDFEHAAVNVRLMALQERFDVVAINAEPPDQSQNCRLLVLTVDGQHYEPAIVVATRQARADRTLAARIS